MSSQVHEFQAEARALLDLMVHSIYSNKDSFLRELISNGSDALDKLRIESLQDKELTADTSDLHIDLIPGAPIPDAPIPDTQPRTLTVADNGIGMSRDEVVELIGTVAKSGTAQLREALAQGEGVAGQDLIGQFGIGFYSTFMVADRVTLVTRKAGEETGTRWESAGEGTYTIEDEPGAAQGTSITLHLKPVDVENGLYDYTDPAVLRGLVKKHSDFISWPIRLRVAGDENAGDESAGDENAGDENGEAGESPEPVSEQLNSGKALWAKSPGEVSAEEYAEFYRHISHAFDEPLETISLHAEGTFEYQALLFLPTMPPFDLFRPMRRHGIQLYVKRVFIMDDCEELIPEYLRFVAGVVDAADLSLNVSREILQQDRQIRAIRRRLVKKVIATVTEMRAKEPEKYQTFWASFGSTFKEGLVNDPDNQQALLKASVFASTRDAAEPTSLDDYLTRAADDQDVIYYMTGSSREQLDASPHLEVFAARGIEVLLLTDPVDEVWAGSGVTEYGGKRFASVVNGVLDLGKDNGDDDAPAADDGELAGLLAWLGETLGEQIASARVSSRLTQSPVCLVGDDYAMPPGLEKMLRATGQPVPHVKRILELNPEHELVRRLASAFGEAGDDRTALEPSAQLLYATAVLAEGGELDDPAAISRLLGDTILKTLG